MKTYSIHIHNILMQDKSYIVQYKKDSIWLHWYSYHLNLTEYMIENGKTATIEFIDKILDSNKRLTYKQRFTLEQLKEEIGKENNLNI